MPRGKIPANLAERTPLAEWVAAGAGLLLTLGVIGYTLWDGFNADDAPPALTVVAEPAIRAGGGYVLPVTIRNDSRATAADVEVRGVLTVEGRAGEERRTSFPYVPGGGEAHGGLVFQQVPSVGRVELSIEGFADP